jgi:hypothetical protein
MNFIIAVFVSMSLLVSAPLALADDVKIEHVQFAHGKTGATIGGAIKGYASTHYRVGATAGQTMAVNLQSKSTSIYFNIFAPGKIPGQDEAMFIGDTGGSSFDGVLPATGDYEIQVYLYRNAARRNQSASFKLGIEITAAGSSEGANAGDAKVAGTDFNATGNIPCGRAADQPMASCKFGVVRDGDGKGSVTVFWPDGGNRVIYFEAGMPAHYDDSKADAGAKMTVGRNADLFIVQIGVQRFEIPDAVISGG